MTQETHSRNQWKSVDKTITPEEVSKLNFIPLGTHVVVETVKPESVSPQGLHVVHTNQDRPVYRVLLYNEDGPHSAHFKAHVKPGTIVRSNAISGLTVPHELPRLPDGTYRRLFMISSDSIDCVFTNAPTWTEKEMEVSRNMQTHDPRTVFTQDVINRVQKDMMTREEAQKIAYQPIGSKILVENAPFKARTNSGIEIGGGRGELVPAYRIIKTDPSFKPFGPLENLREGDFVYLLNVSPADMIPHEIRDSNGRQRKLFLVDMGLIAAVFPNMSWDEIGKFVKEEGVDSDETNAVTLDVEDKVEAQEAVST